MRADSAAALKDAVLPWYYITWIGNAVHYSLVPRPSPAPVFDRLQYAKTEPEGLVNLTMHVIRATGVTFRHALYIWPCYGED